MAPAFEVIRTIEVRCEPYYDLFLSGGAPAPDVIKIDVQGAEYEVLLGFGNLLDSCLAIELETHVYPIYKNQKLFGDLVMLLDGFGFSLRSLERQNNFDGDALEFNCCFTKRRDCLPLPREAAEKKLEFIEQVLALVVFDSGQEIARSYGGGR